MANGTIAASQLDMLSQDGTGIATIVPPATNTNRTLTLPDATTTLVGTNATQTLTNKTIQNSPIQGGAITSATAVSASGTAVDFTGIPSWVKRITVLFSGVSTNGTSAYQVLLGDAGGVETSGYSGTFVNNAAGSSAANPMPTSGFSLGTPTAANTFSGAVNLYRISGDTWVVSGFIAGATSAYGWSIGGSKALSDTLTQVRITTVNGTDTFDAGTINILYEG